MLYGLTIFVSALLLFQVQFIVGKHLLPWFGGGPSVWSTCQVFFQALLLAGYAYVHWLTTRTTMHRQAVVHTILLVIAGLVLLVPLFSGHPPLLAPDGFKPDPNADPVGQLLVALAASAGVPFLLLAATAPLVQHWHSRSRGPLDRTYRLYALSNTGSLLGLISYPFLIEATLDLSTQAQVWTGMFIIFAMACACVAWHTSRTTADQPALARDDAPSPADGGASALARSRPEFAAVALWFLLPLAASLMLVSTTNRLCHDVAVVPFLWMAPLALYLVTFIISFDRPKWYSRGLLVPAALMTIAVLYVARNATTVSVLSQFLIFGLFLFLYCMIAHGELARLRPERSHLTLYFLVIATGGAAGAAVVSFAAPVLFNDFWEFYAGLGLGWLIFAGAWWRDRTSPFFRGAHLQYVLFIGLMVFIAAGILLNRAARGSDVAPNSDWWFAIAIAVNVTVIVVMMTWGRPIAFWGGWSRLFVGATTAAVALGLFSAWKAGTDDQIVVGRNFYGVLRLRLYLDEENNMVLQLTNGNINHGLQVRDKGEQMTPTTYYAPSSGVGLAVQTLRARRENTSLHLGVLGLGTGTLAAYAQPGDTVRFYEINPLVIRLSTANPPIFSFVAGSPGTVTIVPGDARLSLESELASGKPQKFDVLAVDVFSSDAIPVHLMTVEAFETYLAQLRDQDSILAIHTSNRFLDLEPVVAALASRLGLHGVEVQDSGKDPAASSSTWILLAHNREVLTAISDKSERAAPLGSREVLFTDRYSNLFKILNP